MAIGPIRTTPGIRATASCFVSANLFISSQLISQKLGSFVFPLIVFRSDHASHRAFSRNCLSFLRSRHILSFPQLSFPTRSERTLLWYLFLRLLFLNTAVSLFFAEKWRLKPVQLSLRTNYLS